jgi:hypothetical protein
MKVERLIADTYKFIYGYKSDMAFSTIRKIEKIFDENPKRFEINNVIDHLKAFEKKIKDQ